MAFSVGAVFSMVIHGTLDEVGPVSMRYEQELGAAEDPLEFEEVVADLVAVADATIGEYAIISSEYISWIGASIQTLNGTDVSGFVPFDAPIPGLVEGATVPTPCAVVANYATGISKHQLRKFIPGAPIDDVSLRGRIDPAAALAWGAVAADVLTPIEGTYGLWYYVSVSKLGTPEQFILRPRAVSIKPEWGVQGRRRIAN